MFQLIAVRQSILNWKMKTYFFLAARLVNVVFIAWEHNGFCFTYLVAQAVSFVFCTLMLYDSEQAMMDLYYEKEENRKEKVKWLSVLNTLPFFVMVYDKSLQKVNFLN